MIAVPIAVIHGWLNDAVSAHLTVVGYCRASMAWPSNREGTE